MIIKTLTIIVPCYKIDKNKEYINTLLNSLNSQNCNSVVIEKIILINDSPELNLIEYLDTKNITSNLLIKNNKKNFGQAFSRNFGLSLVKTEYVHFIDQDDYVSENFYFNLDFNSEVIIAKCSLKKNEKKINHSKWTRDYFLKKYNKLKKLQFFLLFDNIVLSPGQVVFKTEVIQKVNGFPVLINYGSDDYGLMFNLSKLDLNYNYNENSTYYHRLHDVQGKKYLNMSASRSEFLSSVNKNSFSFFCLINRFPINIIKKIMYIIFYNRL